MFLLRHRLTQTLTVCLCEKNFSTKKLQFLQTLHISPINVRVFHEKKEFVLKKVSRFICFQRFSCLNVASWQCSWPNNQSTRG